MAPMPRPLSSNEKNSRVGFTGGISAPPLPDRTVRQQRLRLLLELFDDLRDQVVVVLDDHHRGAHVPALEIGGTYYHPDIRGGPANPSAKRLLMAHAFESGARRVQYKVDALNARSRAAVLKLGAVQEGILRQDRVTWTGRIRDTVVFSILADEWPAVRERLDARLAGFA